MSRPRSNRAGRSVPAVLGFLALFFAIIFLTAHFYLLPTLGKALHATHEQRRKMAANSLLLMAVLLTILLVGLLLSFRISRFFFPRDTTRRAKTRYVDAWKIAGERMAERDPPEIGSNDD